METQTNIIRPLLKSKFARQPIFVTTVLLTAVILTANVLRWTLVDWLTPFIEPALEMGLGCALLCALLWSIIHFGLQFRKQGVGKAGVPLLINAATVLIVLFVPFTRITTALSFRWNYDKRMEVVSDVLKGKLGKSVVDSGARGNLIHLPPSYRGLSAGGDDILVSTRDGQTLILFFDFRGVLDSFSGFVYSSGDAKPRNDDFGGQFFEVERLRPNWYWVSSGN